MKVKGIVINPVEIMIDENPRKLTPEIIEYIVRMHYEHDLFPRQLKPLIKKKFGISLHEQTISKIYRFTYGNMINILGEEKFNELYKKYKKGR